MSPVTIGGQLVSLCFPRVSGDEPQGLAARELLKRFSPRERG